MLQVSAQAVDFTVGRQFGEGQVKLSTLPGFCEGQVRSRVIRAMLNLGSSNPNTKKARIGLRGNTCRELSRILGHNWTYKAGRRGG